MQLRNSTSRYGVVSIVLHWGVALAVFGLFGLGLWMVGLDYYSPWRKAGPDLHKSIGLVLLAVLSLIHISEPTRLHKVSRMPSSA